MPTKPKTECCRECYGNPRQVEIFGEQFSCRNPNCPCHQPKTECCELCNQFNWQTKEHLACSNPNCECHQPQVNANQQISRIRPDLEKNGWKFVESPPPKPAWEDELYVLKDIVSQHEFGSSYWFDYVKPFISNLLLQSQKDIIEKVREEVEKMIENPEVFHGMDCQLLKRPCGIICPKEFLADRCEKIPRSLDDVLNLLTELNQ